MFFRGFALLLLASAELRVACRWIPDGVGDFVLIFSSCRRSSADFDRCMIGALNDARRYFKSGVPELGVAPFDPFFAEEVTQEHGGATLNYKLTLRNVYESGWTRSRVTEFKSDLPRGYIRYHQFFPEKYLRGEWYIVVNGLAPYANSGTFDLALYNYTQVTTVRKRRADEAYPFAVRIEALDSGNLELHISNLLKGRTIAETILDRLINLTWRPGFELLKPVIDDLVSKAFTKIFNDDFRDFPFDAVIPR